ncbi:hypothetical protein ACOMHN_014079 [Nucella lapillus]
MVSVPQPVTYLNGIPPIRSGLSSGSLRVLWPIPRHMAPSVSHGSLSVTWLSSCHTAPSVSHGSLHVTWLPPCHTAPSVSCDPHPPGRDTAVGWTGLWQAAQSPKHGIGGSAHDQDPQG